MFRFQNTSCGPDAWSYLIDRYLWNPQAVDQCRRRRSLPSHGCRVSGDAGRLPTIRTPSAIWPFATRTPASRRLSTTTYRLLRQRDLRSARGRPSSSVDCIFGYNGQMLDQATGLQTTSIGGTIARRAGGSARNRWESSGRQTLPLPRQQSDEQRRSERAVERAGGRRGRLQFPTLVARGGAFHFDPSQPISPPEPSPLMTFAYAVGGAEAATVSQPGHALAAGGVRPPTNGVVRGHQPRRPDHRPLRRPRPERVAQQRRQRHGPIIDLYGDRTPMSEWRAGNKGVGSL